jgi:uncharacterized protein YecE (DUF72 family)
MTTKARIYIGTSGWSYPTGEGTWKGNFYPAGIKNELEYYSRFFNAVEINSSFYRPPNPAYTNKWVRQVPDGFLFTAKLWQKFTHPAMFEKMTGEEAGISQQDVDVFKRSIAPLAESGKLGTLLAQFPPSFRNNAFSRQVLSAVARTFSEYSLAIELRHCSWSDDKTTAKLLQELNVAWANIDEPKFPSSISIDVPLTSDMAYFRFHGRNKETWWQGNNETRYKYLYSPEEICELAHRVETAGEHSRLLFAFFNNHWKAYAPRNAVSMMKTLQLPLFELPRDDGRSEEDIFKPRLF